MNDGGKNYWAELGLVLVSWGLFWYFMEPRANPVAAFWFYNGKYARQWSDYSYERYRDVIKDYYNG